MEGIAVNQRLNGCLTALAGLLLAMAGPSWAEERRIEEIVVTAEKRQSTVSDTSISITAFGEDMIEDLGLQGPDELVNFIPATTRDAFDIRIRGVGRNFRALGGDPGVATYYNGIYSEDFGIAATENGLYDVERIEVLRGPQGTLYGRNSIGGALNYITKKPTQEFEAELRAVSGSLDSREYYGILSGPIIKDKLAVRLNAVMRDRDGSQDGINGTEDIDSINDENFSIALNWNISDNWDMNLRWNDRKSDRRVGQSVVVDEGALGMRGVRNSSNYARGVRAATADTAGAMMFTSPGGAVAYGQLNRPGVDSSPSANPNGAFGNAGLRLDRDLKDLDGDVATDNGNNEQFLQNGIQFDLSWDINDTTSLKYMLGWSDFDYTFDIDLDAANSAFTQPRQTVLEAVETHSHELQLLWQLGDKLEMTSGLYYFESNRLQNYAFRDLESQGRNVDATTYGNMAGFLPFLPGLSATHTRRGATPVGTSTYGIWEGDPTGAFYEYWNKTRTEASAVYTQGTYTFNEQWALTVGLRWAEDKKEAFEDRTGRFELGVDGFGPSLAGAFDAGAGFAGASQFFGLTPLALANIFAGNAAASFNPADPITPTCGLSDPKCASPLWLTGLPLSFADRAQGEDEWSDTNFRVNLDYTPNDDVLVYFGVTTGYRSGGYSLGIGDSRGPGAFGGIEPLTYDQEEVMAYELGYKGLHLDGKLQLNASLYRYDYDDYQDRVEIYNEASQSSQDQVRNAGSAENQGFEIEVLWYPTESLTIGGNASWTETEYNDDIIILEDDNPAYPDNLFFGDVSLAQNLKGNSFKRIPETKYTLWGSYSWRFDAGSLIVGASYAYTGEYYSSGIERSLDEVPERERTDVSLTWRDSSERWTARAFVDNVFDERYTRGIGTATASGDWMQTAEILYPRYYGLDVTYRWGEGF